MTNIADIKKDDLSRESYFGLLDLIEFHMAHYEMSISAYRAYRNPEYLEEAKYHLAKKYDAQNEASRREA